jgi:hypothetical protein
MSLLAATPASLREALRAGVGRFLHSRCYKYWAPTEPLSADEMSLCYIGEAFRALETRLAHVGRLLLQPLGVPDRRR